MGSIWVSFVEELGTSVSITYRPALMSSYISHNANSSRDSGNKNKEVLNFMP